MSSVRAKVLAIAVVLGASACSEGVRSGTVHQGHLPYGPWWRSSVAYDGPLQLGRPRVLPASTRIDDEDESSDDTPGGRAARRGASGSASESAGTLDFEDE